MKHNSYDSVEQMNLAAGRCLQIEDYNGALENFNKALELLPKGFHEARAQLYSNRGHALVSLQRYQDALSSFIKAAENFKQAENNIGLGEQLGNIGSVYRDIEKWDDSLDIYFKALQVFMEVGHKAGIADQYSNIGYSYSRKGEFKDAFRFFGDAKALYDELGNIEKAQLCDQNLNVIKLYKKS